MAPVINYYLIMYHFLCECKVFRIKRQDVLLQWCFTKEGVITLVTGRSVVGAAPLLEVRAGEILLTNHRNTFASSWEIPLTNNQILLQIWRNPRGWGEGRRRGAVPLGSCRGEAFHTAGGQGWGRPAVNKIPAAQKYFSQLNEIIIARKKNTSHNSMK